MQSVKNFSKKDILTQAIFAGAAVMVVFFIVSLFLPKQWLVSGKIVVFPSGSPATAAQNLAAETGNTAEIIKSDSFQKNNFENLSENFSDAKIAEGSSVVQVDFRSSEENIQAYEDLMIKIPSQVNDYARDIYGGSPFKYKLISDPEISKNPVKPNLLLNSMIGFLAGFLVYSIWKILFGVETFSGAENGAENEKPLIVSPKMETIETLIFEDGTSKKEKKEAKSVEGEGKTTMENSRSHFVPEKKGEIKSVAPENLPFVDEAVSSSAEEAKEPSDEEVKERLNRLMRGEL